MNQLFKNLKESLVKSRTYFLDGLGWLKGIGDLLDEEMLERIEEILIGGDVGVENTEKIIEAISRKSKEISDSGSVFSILKEEIIRILNPDSDVTSAETLRDFTQKKPYVILLVGVNGTGKTTTAGKLAKKFRDEECSVLLTACDTFRAAASEQLSIWADRTDSHIIRGEPGSDPASVAYDAIQRAEAREIDVVIIDTAGRLHTKVGLMAELEKIKRVLGRIREDIPHETLLILDGTTGQNALHQARTFQKSLGLTGVVITKLDGTAKGGIVIAVAGELGIPVRLIGTGETVNDLRPFKPEEFTEALFSSD